MPDSQNAPLTDAERAELEELRAEKARREEEETARRERAELEALRAQRDAAGADARPSVPVEGPARRVSAPSEPEGADRGAKTFGQRMVTSDATDGDGIPTMPPAQKIVIAVCLIGVLAFAAYRLFLS